MAVLVIVVVAVAVVHILLVEEVVVPAFVAPVVAEAYAD